MCVMTAQKINMVSYHQHALLIAESFPPCRHPGNPQSALHFGKKSFRRRGTGPWVLRKVFYADWSHYSKSGQISIKASVGDQSFFQQQLPLQILPGQVSWAPCRWVSAMSAGWVGIQAPQTDIGDPDQDGEGIVVTQATARLPSLVFASCI